MKKLLSLSLMIFCFYGCKSLNSDSEISYARYDYTLSHLGDYGLYANIMNLYCDNKQKNQTTTLTFNDKMYSKMEVYYANESNLKKLVMRQDPTNFLERWFGCDYDTEVCRDSSTEKRPDTYQVLTYNTDGKYSIEFKEFSQNTDLTTTLKEQIKDGTARQLNYFAITRDTEEILINTSLGSSTLKKHEICLNYGQDIRKRYGHYNSRAIHRGEQKEYIEINGKKYDTKYDRVESDRGEASHTAWIATNGELKGFGVKTETVAATCRTYKDTIVISQTKNSNDESEKNTMDANCKEFIYLFDNHYMKEFNFIPMNIHR